MSTNIKKNIKIFIFLCFSCFLLTSSASAAVTVDLNKPMDKVQYKQGSTLPKGVSILMLQNAWTRLSRATGLSAYLVYDDSKEMNAYITKAQNGKFLVVVFRGLLDIFQTEDEIAGVLGHEMAHGIRRHLDKAAGNQIGINVAANLLSNLLGNSSLGDLAVGAGAALAKNGYSREAEVEADDYGTEYAAKAGYSPWSLYNSVKRMAEAGAVTPPSGFNSHPPTERRMKRLKDKAEYWEKQLHGASSSK